MFGVTSTIALTRGDMRARAASGSGVMSARQGRGTVSIPIRSSHILWLKYQGAGSMTASPGAAIVAIAAQKAMLQPAVIATSAGAMVPP